jgi:plastocyanin
MSMRQVLTILAIVFLLAACAPQAPEVMPATGPLQPPALAAEPVPAQEPVMQPEAAPAAPPAASAAPQLIDVEIKGFRFNPAVITIRKGETVRWTNRDSAPHDATGTGWATRTPLKTGESDQVTFNTPGTYDYICSIHPNMKAKVIVE